MWSDWELVGYSEESHARSRKGNGGNREAHMGGRGRYQGGCAYSLFFSQLQEVFRLFDNANCPNLQNKPKMFFIQACRGGE